VVNGRSGAVPVMRRGKPAVYIVADAFYRQATAEWAPAPGTLSLFTLTAAP